MKIRGGGNPRKPMVAMPLIEWARRLGASPPKRMTASWCGPAGANRIQGRGAIPCAQSGLPSVRRRIRRKLLAPCELASCRICGREFRYTICQQLMRLADSASVIATGYLGQFQHGDLKNADLDRTKDSLRTRCDRAGLRGALIAGGIEAEWNSVEVDMAATRPSRHHRRHAGEYR